MMNVLKRIFKQRLLFNDLQRAKPVSAVFGLDRGTPIDRYYIERFLECHSFLIKGTVLEVGDGFYTRRYGGDRVQRADVLHAVPGNPQASIVGDLTDVRTLPENIYDCFICTQTFNFIFDIQRAIEGAHRLVKPGGTLIATVAGISQISRYDLERWGDYWRFTTASIKNMFTSVFTGELEVESYGNVLAAVALLQGLSVEDLPNSALLDDRDPDYQVIITIVARKGGSR
ncbi:MAG TPA: methyltransferase domain-containing protein [Saprospiraceae bacterium]|nr:methyltransferase domain-containing protein [Saprospiraceae bacterium]